MNTGIVLQIAGLSMQDKLSDEAFKKSVENHGMDRVSGDEALNLREEVENSFCMEKSLLPFHSLHTGDDSAGHGVAHNAMDRSMDPVQNYGIPFVLTPS